MLQKNPLSAVMLALCLLCTYACPMSDAKKRASSGGKARAAKLSPEQRSSIASQGAKGRWSVSKKPTRRKTRGSRNTFGQALVQAERELSEAINARNELISQYHVVNNEIPRLKYVVDALRAQQQGTQYQSLRQPINVPPMVVPRMAEMPMPDIPPAASIPEPTMEGFGFVLPAQQPAATAAAMPPAPRVTRAGGGAGIPEIGDPTPVEEEDEDRFLRASPMAGGDWK